MSGLLRGSFGLLARAASNEAGEKWSVIFPRGTWHGANLAAIGGSISLTDDVFTEMIANWKAEGSPALPVYFHHPPPIDEVPAKERAEVFRAAGHIEDFRITERGLEARTTWSAEGQAKLEADAYRFWSPEWQPEHKSRRDGKKHGWLVTAAALTDSPFFNEMPRLAAAAPTRTKEQQMEFLLKVATLLGLANTATESDVLTNLTARIDDEPKKLTAAVKGATDPLEAKLTAANAEITTLKAAAEKTEKSRFEEQVATAIKEAKLEGRAVDALVATKTFKAATDIESVRELLATVGKDVPLKAKGDPGKAGELTAADAKKQYDTLIAAEQAKGTKFAEANRLVARAHPELSARVFGHPVPVSNPAS